MLPQPTSGTEPTSVCWPPDLRGEVGRRIRLLHRIRHDARFRAAALLHYVDNPLDFIRDWVWTYDPRNTGGVVHLPLVPFPRQEDFLRWVRERLDRQDPGLCEKSRDCGVTWLCAAFAIWLWRFSDGSSVGFGSRKADLVDRLGDLDSIFEKIRYALRRMPPEVLPEGFDVEEHARYMRIVNPANGASITGEAGDDIGRGGRKSIYFKDESAHYEHPDLIEASLSATTNVTIDVSSVNGPGNPFYEKRHRWGPERVFIFDWRDDPRKSPEWRASQLEKLGPVVVAQEIDRDYGASVEDVLIPGAWVRAALALDLPASGEVRGGLDVADTGSDDKAFTVRKGHVVLFTEAWQKGLAGDSARKALVLGSFVGVERIVYELEGVGTGVSEALKHLPTADQVRFQGWSPGSTSLPGWFVPPSGNDKGKKNADMFLNEKARTWWLLRCRFERTFEHVEGRRTHPLDQLISLKEVAQRCSSRDAQRLAAELSQPTWTRTEAGKIKIIKTPKGYRSPNLADSLMLSYAQVRQITGVW